MATIGGKMGGEAGRFALGILIFFLAMLLLFIAFHPGGANPAQHPDDVLAWLIGEYQGAASGTLKAATSSATSPTSGNPGTPSPPASPAAGGA